MDKERIQADEYLKRAAQAAEKRPRSVMLANAKNILLWEKEFELLREIATSTGLIEKIKWGQPCYTTANDKNVVLIHGTKNYIALAFFKGALLKDGKKILVAETENVQAVREVRLTSMEEIIKLKSVLINYTKEAIEIEKSGKLVPKKETRDFPIPEELLDKFKEMPELKSAFEALTPGRQRGYLFYFSQAKQSRTREERIEKNIPLIIDGVGLNENYEHGKTSQS